MDFLHKDRAQFLAAINLAEHQTGVMAQAIRKRLLCDNDIVKGLGLQVINLDETRSRRDYNKYVIVYDTVLPMLSEALQPEILIET